MVRRPAGIFLAALIAVASTTPAAALAYQPVFSDGGGADAAASIYCTPGLIRLGDPTIWAIPPGDAISGRTQLVAWNVQLWYSSDTKNWGQVTAAPAYWYAGYVNDRYYAIVYNGNWYSSQDNTWGFNHSPSWNAFLKGYYAAIMQIVWYNPDGTVSILTAQPTAYTLGAGGLWSDRSPYCTMY